MIGVAAGMALEGYSVFCYSIAPFITLRPLEQIRNDICLHKLPVHIIGNGGGYGYGIMGSSHHALEDIALMRSMPRMQCYLPAFSNDVEPMLLQIITEKAPSYLRLGLGFEAPENNSCKPVIKINTAQNPKVTAVICGPVVNNLLSHPSFISVASNVDLFLVKRFPFTPNEELIQSLKKTKNLLTVEEHYPQGGLGEMLSNWILNNGIQINKAVNRCAAGYPSGLYGSQKFHQKESGLDGDSLIEYLKNQ
jgi:transketolase